MKKRIKLFLLFLFFIFLFGCNLNNTPTSKVEERLSNYNMLDKRIDNDIDRGVQLLFSYIQNNDVQNIDSYRKLVYKQYKNIVYEVKDEIIDGDSATITVEIEVLDFKKVLEDNNKSLVELLENTKDKVTYTIDFYVIKDKEGNWILNEPDDITISKLLGLY